MGLVSSGEKEREGSGYRGFWNVSLYSEDEKIGDENFGRTEYFEYVQVQPEIQVVEPLHPIPPPVALNQHFWGQQYHR